MGVQSAHHPRLGSKDVVNACNGKWNFTFRFQRNERTMVVSPNRKINQMNQGKSSILLWKCIQLI